MTAPQTGIAEFDARRAVRADVRRMGAAADGLAILRPENTAAISGQWRALAGRAAEDNVFYAPEVLLPAIAHLEPTARIAVLRSGDGRLAGLAPLRRVRLGRIAPAVSTLAHDYGPLGVPLAEDGQADAMTAALFSATATLAGPRAALVLPLVPVDGPLANALRRRAAAEGRRIVETGTAARAVLDRDADGDDPRAGLVRRRRKEYARQYRRLAEIGRVTLDIAATSGEVALAFAEFLALEAGGWKGRRGTALAHQAAPRAFAREAVTALAAAGACRILALRVAARPVAMLVCFLGARTATTWKIAFDEAYSAYSPGAQLMLEAPRILFAEPGITRIDSLAAPGHPMIDHLWPGRLALTPLVVSPARGRLQFRAGLLARAAEEAARTIARRARHRLRGQKPTPNAHGESPDGLPAA